MPLVRLRLLDANPTAHEAVEALRERLGPERVGRPGLRDEFEVELTGADPGPEEARAQVAGMLDEHVPDWPSVFAFTGGSET